MLQKTLILAIVVIVFSPTARSAEQPSYGPPQAWVRPVTAPAAAMAGAMTETPVRVLYQNRQLQFSQDTVSTYTETFARMQTPQGLQALGSLNLPWRADTDVLTIHKLYLLRGDKTIDLLANGQAFTVLRREDRLEHSMLDGILTASIQPPGMEVGDFLNIAFTLERTNKVLGSPDFSLADLDLFRVEKLDLRAAWERPTAVRWYATPQMKGIKETRKGARTELTWSATDLGPIEQPTDVPVRFWVSRRMDFTSSGSWSDLSKRLAPLYASATTLKADSPLLNEAAAIRTAHATPEARAGAALKLVQDRVRYVFFGMNDGALVPTAADLTWTQKFGDCKGKTALLLALLRELGIDAEPVMVNTVMGDGLSTMLPMGLVFDHVLVRAHIGGRAYWLDGTGSGDTRLEFLGTPNYFWGLPLQAAGSELVRMISEPLQQPSSDLRIRIDASKGIHAPAPFTVESTMRGPSASSVRTELASLPRADQERTLRDYWSKQYAFVTIKSVSSGYDDTTGAYTMKMSGEAKLDWPRDYYETDNLRLGYKMDLKRKDGPNRDAPYRVNHPVHTHSVEEIVLPANGVPFSIYGTNIRQTVGGVEYTRHSVIENGVFRGEATTRSVATEFAASQAADVERDMLAMAKNVIYVEALDSYKFTEADLDAKYGSKLATAEEYADRGRALFGKRAYARAIAAYDSALALDTRYDRALGGRAESRFWSGEPAAAVKDANAALLINPKNSMALAILGAVAIRNKDLKSGLAHLDMAVELDPTSAFIHGERAGAYVALNELDKALSESAEALRLTKTWIEMYDLRVNVLSRKHDWPALAKELEAMLEKHPDSARAHTSAAYGYALMFKLPEAIRAADRAIELEPSEYLHVLRASLRPWKDHEARGKDLDEALKLKPDSAQALTARGQLHSEMGNYEAAAAVQSRMLELSPEYRAHALITRGVQYVKAGKSELAEADFRDALGDKSDATMLNNFCWELATSNLLLERALEACELALTLKPGHAAYLDSKGMALLQLGRYEEAVKAYDAAVAARPEEDMSLFGRGLARQRLCTCDAGDEDMNAARKLNPAVNRHFEYYGIELAPADAATSTQ